MPPVGVSVLLGVPREMEGHNTACCSRKACTMEHVCGIRQHQYKQPQPSGTLQGDEACHATQYAWQAQVGVHGLGVMQVLQLMLYAAAALQPEPWSAFSLLQPP